MFSLVLKSFPYAADGVTVEWLQKNAEVEINDGVAGGLKTEGFIRPLPGPKMCPACTRNPDDSVTCHGKANPACGQHDPAAVPPALLGSSIQPAVQTIGGKEVQLGTIVAMAHTESGLSVEDWNKLEPQDCEARIAAVVVRLRAEAAVAVEIPEGWRELKGPELMALAGQLTADPVKSKSDAVRVLEAELARREAAKQA